MNTNTSNERAEGAETAGDKRENVPEGNGSSPEEASPADELKNRLQEAEKKYLYLYSEFENFRKRNERDRLEFLKFGHEGFLRDLLQVLDNFERALEHAKSLGTENGSAQAQVIQGVEMTHFQLLEALRNQGVNPVQALGKKFDPALHEAVGDEESESEAGTILKEAQRGYTLHGRLLRPARVVVAKKKA
jgi:molecular chaperone GrpE